MTLEEAAQGFAAMGSEARLDILRVLVRAGQSGLTVGDIGERTGVPPSTLAHHLKFLVAAGVLEQERAGRSVITRAAFDHLQALVGFIMSECCVDQTRKAANDG